MSQRVKTGFHRIGMVGVALGSFVFLANLAMAAYQHFAGDPNVVHGLLAFGAICLGLGAVWYGASRVMAWVVEGFVDR